MPAAANPPRVETVSLSAAKPGSWHNGPVMPSRPLLLAVSLVVITAVLGSGCARPYAGPKTLAALGVGLLAAGGTTWIVADHEHRDGMAVGGLITTLAGAAAVAAAGGWLAVGVACTDDVDCPRSEECRVIPTRPGGVPYYQCMPRRP